MRIERNKINGQILDLRWRVEGELRVSLFLDAKDGLAHVFDFAGLSNAFKRKDIVARSKLAGRHDEKEARTGSRRFGFKTRATEDLFAADRLQHGTIALIVALFQLQLEMDLRCSRGDDEDSGWAGVSASDSADHQHERHDRRL